MRSAIRCSFNQYSALLLAPLLAIVNFVAGGGTCSAQEAWPSVRGPSFNGHADGVVLADRWPEQGPPVLWVRKLGQGYSAFVADGERVFTQSQNMTGQFVYCLEADTGQTIWEYRYDWPYEAAGVYPGPRSTPSLYKGRVYFTSPDGLLACLSQSSGELKWSVDLLDTYGIEGCDFGYACSPTLIDNKVILPVGGRDSGVVAFDSVSGAELWRSTSEPASYTPALPIEVNGEPLVVCYMQNSLLILNRDSGQLKRRLDLSSGYDEHSAWPIYQEPQLWLSAPFKAGSYALDLSGLEADTQELRRAWTTPMMSNDVCSSVCVDGYIYGFDIFDVQSKTHRPSRGIFRCLEWATGAEAWSNGTGKPTRSANAVLAAGEIGQCGIIAVDDKLVILNELGELILLEANPEECVELARCFVLKGELTWTAPCLHRGRLYVRNQSQAVCVYIGSESETPVAAIQRTGDLVQRQYYNLAALILAVEPEYAFDIPHQRWLILWYLTGLAILIPGRLLVGWALVRFRGQQGLSSDVAPSKVFLAAFIPGLIGTTLLGWLTGEFVFTWPVCLYAALEYVVASRAVASEVGKSNLRTALIRRWPLFVFLIVCAGYFLTCRRLSLVFEWAFLIGFVGALPVIWCAHRFRPKRGGLLFFHVIATTLIGFSAFFGATVVFLDSRY